MIPAFGMVILPQNSSTGNEQVPGWSCILSVVSGTEKICFVRASTYKIRVIAHKLAINTSCPRRFSAYSSRPPLFLLPLLSRVLVVSASTLGTDHAAPLFADRHNRRVAMAAAEAYAVKFRIRSPVSIP